MHKKWLGYSLVSVASFCVFTVLFHTVVHAQMPETPLLLAQITETPKQPTPTIYFAPQQGQAQQLVTKAPEEKKELSPTPTIYFAPTKTETEEEPTPTTTPLPTATPTVAPTATPQPTAIPTTAPVGDLESFFTKYSSEYGIDKEQLKKIARCESGFNPTSNNSGMYLGMYQFAAATWSANRARMGLDPNPDLRLNAEESIRTAAYMLSKGQQRAWPNCH